MIIKLKCPISKALTLYGRLTAQLECQFINDI